jgi:hypothetical protein
MASEKALYWLAVGMMGLFLMNSVAVRHQDWLNRLEARSIQVAERISGGTMASLNLGEMRLGLQSSPCARTRALPARMQAKLACMEAAMARHQARLAQFETHKEQLEVMQRMRFAMMPANQDFRFEVPPHRFLPANGTI